MIQENINHKTQWTLTKFDSQAAFDAAISFEEKVIPRNLLLSEGITALANLLMGATATPFNNANSFIGVGDSTTAAGAAQTGLQATTNKIYKAMEAGYPVLANQTITWRAIFGATEANFNWNEFTVANGNSDAAINLNRRVSAQGTKASGQVWTLDVQVTFS